MITGKEVEARPDARALRKVCEGPLCPCVDLVVALIAFVLSNLEDHTMLRGRDNDVGLLDDDHPVKDIEVHHLQARLPSSS